MIDAYTIGITLALEDGVSDGIVAIRRDLALLDVAIIESAARLTMLRKLAADTGLSTPVVQTARSDALFARPTPDRQAGPPTVSPAQPRTIADTIAPSPLPPLDPQIAEPHLVPDRLAAASNVTASRPVDVPARASPVSTQASPVRASPPTIRPPSVQPPSVTQAAVPPSTAPAISNDGFRLADLAAIAQSLIPSASRSASTPLPEPGPKPSNTSEALSSPTTAPSIKPPPSSALMPAADRAPIATQSTPPPHTGGTAGAMSGSLILAKRGVSSARDDSSQSSASRQSAPKPQRPAPAHTASWAKSSKPSHPVSVAVDSPITPPQYAPAVLPALRISAPTEKPTDTANPQPVVPSVDTSEANRPTHAELHLDGAALGRWVTRYLERQVTRPQAGATGFDPRMSPNWAGAPIGN